MQHTREETKYVWKALAGQGESHDVPGIGDLCVPLDGRG